MIQTSINLASLQIHQKRSLSICVSTDSDHSSGSDDSDALDKATYTWQEYLKSENDVDCAQAVCTWKELINHLSWVCRQESFQNQSIDVEWTMESNMQSNMKLTRDCMDSPVKLNYKETFYLLDTIENSIELILNLKNDDPNLSLLFYITMLESKIVLIPFLLWSNGKRVNTTGVLFKNYQSTELLMLEIVPCGNLNYIEFGVIVKEVKGQIYYLHTFFEDTINMSSVHSMHNVNTAIHSDNSVSNSLQRMDYLLTIFIWISNNLSVKLFQHIYFDFFAEWFAVSHFKIDLVPKLLEEKFYNYYNYKFKLHGVLYFSQQKSKQFLIENFDYYNNNNTRDVNTTVQENQTSQTNQVDKYNLNLVNDTIEYKFQQAVNNYYAIRTKWNQHQPNTLVNLFDILSDVQTSTLIYYAADQLKITIDYHELNQMCRLLRNITSKLSAHHISILFHNIGEERFHQILTLFCNNSFKFDPLRCMIDLTTEERLKVYEWNIINSEFY